MAKSAHSSARASAVTSSHRYLVTNKKSGVFYYRKAVPQGLLGQYQKREIKVSLKTCHKEAALLLYGSVSQRVQMEFAMIRSGHLSSHLQSFQQEHQQVHQREFQSLMTLSALIALYLQEKQGGLD